MDTYAYYLGTEIAKGLPSIGVEFPLIVNRNGSVVSRASIAKLDDGSLIVAGNLYTGENVRIGFGDRKAPAAFVNSCSKFLYLDDMDAEEKPIEKQKPSL